jgi:hypothetical protein
MNTPSSAASAPISADDLALEPHPRAVPELARAVAPRALPLVAGMRVADLDEAQARGDLGVVAPQDAVLVPAGQPVRPGRLAARAADARVGALDPADAEEVAPVPQLHQLVPEHVPVAGQGPLGGSRGRRRR